VKWLAALAACGLLLAACGSQSAAQATKGWMSSSNYTPNLHILVTDIKNSQSALYDKSSTAKTLLTVCSVLENDTRAANSSLPTPDSQATNELGNAYDVIGNGANFCVGAATNTTAHSEALRFLAIGLSRLNEGTLRLQAVVG
jgi:hypothetical protein